MPTGYTTNLTTFDAYLLRCARAFGAAVHQKEESADSALRPQTYSNYYKDQLLDSILELKKLLVDYNFDIARGHKEATLNRYVNSINRSNELRAKYESMIEEVHNWVPPSKDHSKLHTFMLEQLVLSRDGDCDNGYITKALDDINPKSYAQIHEELIENCLNDIADYAKHMLEDRQRVNKANIWIAQLQESINESS